MPSPSTGFLLQFQLPTLPLKGKAETEKNVNKEEHYPSTLWTAGAFLPIPLAGKTGFLQIFQLLTPPANLAPGSPSPPCDSKKKEKEGQPYIFQPAFSWFSGQKDGISLGF